MPVKGTKHAVGFDIRADLSRLALEEYEKQKITSDFETFLHQFTVVIEPQEVKLIPTGLKVELAEDMEMDMKSRSGLFLREGLLAVGTIDPDYRGEIGIMIANIGKKRVEIRHHERLTQAVIRKVYNQDDLFIEVSDESLLTPTDRGEGGFGSTGRK